MMGERLFKASEYREAEAEHKRKNPTVGDYWWVDHFCPLLVVLSVAKDFVTVCQTTKIIGDRKWDWDLTKPELLLRRAFEKRLEGAFVGRRHEYAVNMFLKGGE